MMLAKSCVSKFVGPFVFLVGLTACQTLFAQGGAANNDRPEFPGLVSAPTSTDPHGGLAIRDEEASKALFELADKEYRLLVDEISQAEQQMRERGAKSLSVKKLSNLAPNMLELVWAGTHLATLGESAGGDYVTRQFELRQRLNIVLGEVRKIPKNSEAFRTTRPMTDVARKNQGKLKTAIKMANAGNIEKSERAYQEILHNLQTVGMWWFDRGQERSQAFRVYYKFGEQITKAMAEELSKRNTANANAAFKNRRPDFNSVTKQLSDAAAALRSGQQADLDGQAVSGPALVAGLVNKWRQMQLDAFYCQGIELSKNNSGTAEEPAYIALADEQAVFQQSFGKGIADVIISTAEASTPESVPDLYNQYLGAVTSVLPLCRNKSFQNSVEMGLDQLLAKSPDYQQRVVGYREATDDVLRWRKRVASRYADSREESYEILQNMFVSSQGSGVDLRKLLLRKEKREAAYLTGTAPQALEPLVDSMLDRKARFTDIVGPRGDLGYCTSSVTTDTYARFLLNFDFGTEIESLAASLAVSDAHPPLSLNVASALVSAMSGDFEQAGGNVLEIGLEGAIPRLTLLSENDWGMIGLDTTNELQQHLTDRRLAIRLDRVFVRCMVEPDWVQSKYFFVELKAPVAEKQPAEEGQAES